MTKYHMTCCVCGGGAGRWEQHWNRDTEYGICPGCAAEEMGRNTPERMRELYGDWEIEDSAGQYAEWVTIIDGRVISLGDSTLGTGDATILCDDDDTINLRFDGIEFTADKTRREWGLMPEDNWPAVEAAAAKVGVAPADFWARYEPILNRFAGWTE